MKTLKLCFVSSLSIIFVFLFHLGVAQGEMCRLPSGAPGNCVHPATCQNFDKFLKQNPQFMEFAKCTSPNSWITVPEICCPLGGDFSNRFFNLDNVFNAFRQLFKRPNQESSFPDKRPEFPELAFGGMNQQQQRPLMGIGNNNQPAMSMVQFLENQNHHGNQNNQKSVILSRNCGISESEDRIVGGSTAALNEFPWMALLAYTQSGNIRRKSYKCAGTVITERHILTAAHCVEGNLKNDLYSVILGEYDVHSQRDCEGEYCAPPIQEVRIRNIRVHPHYNMRGNSEHDIAILEVNPIDFRPENVKPICLPVGMQEMTGERMTVTGWGLTEKGALSKVLLKVNLPVVSLQDCQNRYRNNKEISDLQICAGGEIGKDSCNGDSGGPLQMERQMDGKLRYYQYGVVSYGPTKCGKSRTPGVYTRVARYTDWILENINN